MFAPPQILPTSAGILVGGGAIARQGPLTLPIPARHPQQSVLAAQQLVLAVDHRRDVFRLKLFRKCEYTSRVGSRFSQVVSTVI